MLKILFLDANDWWAVSGSQRIHSSGYSLFFLDTHLFEDIFFLSKVNDGLFQTLHKIKVIFLDKNMLLEPWGDLTDQKPVKEPIS